jgi:glucosamine--fructose-6-phosphate aminotransferase (isomerizing)
MCGIFAYIGTKHDAGDRILEGLKSLEYRGYDSWGVACKQQDGSLFLEKETGKIGTAVLPKVDTTVGIGHTRWATHGGVTRANAHPHTDAKREVVIVHNGIVENFGELKHDLVAKGYTFLSETDSEVIAHLIADERSRGVAPEAAVRTVFGMLHGMNAVIAFFPSQEEFYVVKNGSPIVFRSTPSETIIASDASALVPYTRKVYYLEDNETLKVSRSGPVLYGVDGSEKTIPYSRLSFSEQDVALGDFPHFMIKEIHEQPRILRHIVDTQRDTIVKAASVIKQAYGTYLVACGTAAYACLAGTYLFSKIAKRHVNFSIASEFGYLIDFLKESSLVVALSQSGETIDLLSSLDGVKRKGSRVMALTNVRNSTLDRMAHFTLSLDAGPEKAVCSTKAYTAKIAFLYLIAWELAGDYETGATHLRKAIAEVERVLEREDKIKALAGTLKDANHMFILGRGVSYPTAMESSLKIKEVSYVHAEGFAGGELKHGVIALIEKGTPVIVYNPHDETYHDMISSAHEVKARGAHVIGISSKESDVYDTFVKVDDCGDATIIPNVVVAQLLGYYMALGKGFDPDKPRNLAKSVVVK